MFFNATHVPTGSKRQCIFGTHGRLLLATVTIPSMVVLLLFLAAEDAATIQDKGYSAPEGWSAGVFNHGRYIGWWSIDEQPVLFLLAAIGSLTGVLGILLAFYMDRLRVLRKRMPCGSKEETK